MHPPNIILLFLEHGAPISVLLPCNLNLQHKYRNMGRVLPLLRRKVITLEWSCVSKTITFE